MPAFTVAAREMGNGNDSKVFFFLQVCTAQRGEGVLEGGVGVSRVGVEGCYIGCSVFVFCSFCICLVVFFCVLCAAPHRRCDGMQQFATQTFHTSSL